MIPLLFSSIVALTNLCGIVSVDTRGARIVSYVPVGGDEVFSPSHADTGGMPLCWPWFAEHGPSVRSRQHGVARYHDFKVESIKSREAWDSELTLRLDSNAETHREFPHDFTLEVSIRLTDRLTVSMSGTNTGRNPFPVAEAFFPYFSVGDSELCRIDDAGAGGCLIADPVSENELSLICEGGDCRVWRPKDVPTVPSGDGKRSICIGVGAFTGDGAHILNPGENHSLTCAIRLATTHIGAKPIDLQPSIDACAASGGGRVNVPPGKWLSRAIRLGSNVELHLPEDATVVFRDEPDACLPAVRTSYSAIECYGLSPMIYAFGATNVSITGCGTLIARMGLWREWFLRDAADMDCTQRRLYTWGENDTPVEERRFADLRTARMRPCFVEFERCGNVRLEGFRIRHSPLWCVHLRLCDRAVVRGLDICARGHNNDGIDVNASRNVLIEDCTLDQGDDGFVIKSGRDRDGRRVGVPCENVEIRNCIVKRAHTLIGVGSEVSGGVRNIALHDCRVEGYVTSVVRVKTSDRKGAFIKNVAVSNVVVEADVGSIVRLQTDVDYQWRKYPPREHMVTLIDGLRVENVKADSVASVYSLHGDSRLPPRNIMIQNIAVKECRGANIAENILTSDLQH